MNIFQQAILLAFIMFIFSNISIAKKLASGQTECINTIVKRNIEGSGYDGAFRMKMPVTVHGWKLILTFDEAFTMFHPWIYDLQSVSQNTYVIKSQTYHGNHVEKGNVLEVKFTAKYANGKEPKLLSARIDYDNPKKTIHLCGPIKKIISVPTTLYVATTVDTKLASGQTECINTIVKGNTRGSGYDGAFRMKMPVTVHEWKLILTFDEAFTMFHPWVDHLQSVSQNTYVIKRQTYHGNHVEKGNILEVRFTAKYANGKEPKLLSARIDYDNPKKTIHLCGPIKKIISVPTKLHVATTVDTTTSTKLPEATPISGETTTDTPLKCISKYNYTEVLSKSLLFYEAQRSGKLPANQRVTWRHDSALDDGQDVGKDLVGGYYDDGGFVKFGFPMASTITNLAWGMIEFKKGYIEAKQYQYGLAALKWGTDYFIKCHNPFSENYFYGQVGSGFIDGHYWGRPEDMTMVRPSQKIDETHPGSDLAAETAAALAATSVVFSNDGDTRYAETLLKHAKELYDFADLYRGLYSDSISEAASYYKSYSGFKDELAWASLWLYKATGLKKYKDKFLTSYDEEAITKHIKEFSWDNKWAGVSVLAARLEITKKDYLKNLKQFMLSGQMTPKGLFFVAQWGSNRHAANIAFLSLIAYKVANDDYYETFGRKQIHYMLGDSGRSYVVGFGNNPPQRPHHKSSSCPAIGFCDWDQFLSPDPNPQILYGALVGGPDANDLYIDSRTDQIKNGVAIDYNAGFQSAIAGLLQLSTIGKC